MSKPLFIHIPKTAGISVKALVGPPEGIQPASHHNTQAQWMEALGESYSDYVKFSIVRDPETRFISAWQYLRNQTPSHPFYLSDQAERLAILRYEQPGDFFEEYGRRVDGFVHLAPQYHWITSDLDYLLHFETLDDDFRDMCKREGWRVMQLPHLNKTRYDVKLELSHFERTSIRWIYDQDYRRYGYDTRL